MTPTRRAVLSTVGTGFALSLAGCGDDDQADGDTPTEDAPTEDTPTEETPTSTPVDDNETDDGATAMVQVRTHDEHGDILVDGDGMTLYMFDQDTQGEGSSTCAGDCADAWPPLTVEDSPTAGPDIAAELTTFERDDDSRQVAANGWPLYYFANDREPGDTNGQGVSDIWWVLTPDGTPRRQSSSDTDSDGTETETPTPTPTTTPTPAEGGY